MRSSAAPLVGDPAVARVGTVALVAAVALSLLLAPLGEPWRTGVAAVVAVVALALGSPHGALDHLVDLTRSGAAERRPAGRFAGVTGLRARFVIPYVAVAGAALVGYLAAPRSGFALFLLLSVVHFAAGEAGVAVERGLARSWGDPLAWSAALGGAVVVVVPLASPEASAALAAVDPRLAPVLAPLPALALVVAALVATALAVCAVAAVLGDARARTVGLELGGLTAVAWLADPLLAFAAFFAGWHAVRHQARLATLLRTEVGTPPRGLRGRPLREVVRSARAGLPATAGVLAAAVAVALSGATVLGALLAVVWALTVPHAAAVALLEVRSARSRRRAPTTAGAPAGEPAGGRDASKPHDIATTTSGPPVAGPPAAPAERLRRG
ncbi:beta-carotene 15,15'-dioxygenase, Brp/Blh family [Aquipuribacter nitratireducens]|uniref:Beta-carotene 15,15'-dioxygenase, Brp/Blh family n=1 Tax=Aquipuribacter nitratireducens TaxID=650104 RepID=A0ABW0GNB1_9MICO